MTKRGGLIPGLILILASLTLAACESWPWPIVRGSGSEHHQNVRVGLPF